ncbi:MAG: hypothetical protein P4L51_17550 [Puia sp.]|nr:hypothetical protein [Puia sp.]
MGPDPKWKTLAPQCPFEYFFLDEAIDNQYRSDANFGRLFFYFGLFAIFISCMGLLGLTLFNTYKKTKEIGIRKVLGAGVFSIVHLFLKDFLKLVIVAFLIAAPVARVLMNKWLHEFAYRITISWWVFAVSGHTVILLAFVTISFQTIKAALANPVKSLGAG